MSHTNIFFVFAFLHFCSAAVVNQAPCPDVKAVENFNITSYYSGIWYEIAKYPNEWQKDEDCTYLKFEKQGDDIVFNDIGVARRHNQVINGVVKMAKNAGTSGIVNLVSKSFAESEGDSVLQYHILDTDYQKYAISYECIYDKSKNQRKEFAWVDSRTKQLDSETKKIVDNFLKKSDLLDENLFIWENLSDQSCKTD